MLVVALQPLFAPNCYAQSIVNEKVTLSLADDSLATAISKIERQSVFRFFYRSSDIKPVTHLNLPKASRTICQTLEALLQNTSLSFRQIDDNILLERKDQQYDKLINGRVIDRITKRPVANASVFLNNTSTGTQTTNDGTFAFNNTRAGKYELVVSVIGFETYKQSIIINNRNIVLGDIEISPKQIVLHEVSVTARRQTKDERQKYLSWFTNEFIGTSAVAEQCRILNPEVLDLSYDVTKNTLTASSSDFLVVDNRALGYRIKYMLTNFKLDNDPSAKIRLDYEGSILFEELPGAAKQQKRWQKHRQSVYEGSVMHFLRSAAADAIEREGFRVLRQDNYANPERLSDSLIQSKIAIYKKLKSRTAADSLSFWNKKLRLPRTIEKLIRVPLHKVEIIKQTDQPGLFAFGPGKENASLYITYNKNHHYYINNEAAYINGPNNKETTIVSFNAPYALFYNSGWLVPGYVMFNGTWANNRVAELLPVDYDPIQSQVNANAGITSTAGMPKALIGSEGSLQAGLFKLKAISDSCAQNKALEKLYLQFDKPYYTIGDTIWFKAYLFNAAYLTATDKSGILYVDLINDSSKAVKHFSLPLQAGLGWGDIGLDEKDFGPGTYTVRAYTTWMRNFDDNGFFSKRFYITGGESNWLVNKQVGTSTLNGDGAANVKLQFCDIDRKPAANETFELEVLNGNKHLYKQAVQTDGVGVMDVNFKLPQKTAGLAIVAQNEKKDKKAVIPIVLNTPDKADIQFLPEGGNLVAGLPAHVGFKAIGEDGRGINVTGVIVDHEQKPVAEFKSLHNGMGSFSMAAREGESYIAKVTLPGGQVKDYPLPPVKNNGVILQIKNPMDRDSVEVFVAATNDVVQSGNNYFLIGKARGIVCYAAVIAFRGNNYVKRKVAKNLFPSGITHFSLMSTKYQPLNERLVFVDHHDDLHIQLADEHPAYTVADSVALHVRVTDNSGDPVQGYFSMAVTNDADIKNDSLNNENILTRILLTSDLKGYVEQPGYYFSKTGEAWSALDNLLLTQGWAGYDWQQVFNPPTVTYPPEREFAVKGKVINAFGKPVKNTYVLLFSKSPAILMDTTTDKEGRFVFDHFPPVDTPLFVIKAVNKNGKSFNVGIVMDEIKPPEVKNSTGPLINPWYVNTDTTLINYTRASVLAMEQIGGPRDKHLLNEVKISARKIVKDSQNLNGPGNADQVLDEKDLEKAGKMNLRQLLEEKINGFREGTLYLGFQNAIQWYFVRDKLVRIIIDGIDLSKVVDIYPVIKLTRYLEAISAQDMKGIEVMSSNKFALNYSARFYTLMDRFAFVEITTRSGRGPLIGNTPGMYVYKPLALSWPRQFYKPRYTPKDAASRAADLRSTIDWEPNIVTDINGKATVSFYAAGKPSTYTMIIEGTDMNGDIGYHIQKIKIDPENKYP